VACNPFSPPRSPRSFIRLRTVLSHCHSCFTHLGVAVQIPVRPSNVVITKLFLNAGRKALLERKAAGGKVQKATKVSAGEKLD